jgi:hypothetical protein
MAVGNRLLIKFGFRNVECGMKAESSMVLKSEIQNLQSEIWIGDRRLRYVAL